jgi:type I restriction enzyme S subunit
MIDGLRPYAEMRPSGVEWLPALPQAWEIHRAKYSFKEADDRSEAGDEELLSVSHKTGVTPRSQKNITMFMAESYEGHKVCRPGDVVVNTMWAWMAAIGVSRHVGIVSPAYGIYRPRAVDRFEPKFLDYLLRTEVYRAEYLRSSRGVTTSRLRLYPPDFLNIPFVQPPLGEQRLIVRFLDWHGAQTAKLIRAKKKIIALLNEQKQAIIIRAVTRGLDPNVRLKPSGIPWLGDVPERWSIQSLGSMIKRRSARNRTDLPLLSVVRERGVILRSSMSDEENHNFVPDDLSNYKVAMRGDLVINKMKAWQGSLGIAPCDGIVSPAYFVYQLDIEDIAFGQMLLRSKPYVACFARVSDGVRIGQWDLSIDGMKRIPVLRPSRDEQIAIVEFVDRSTLELEKIKEFTLREIALIQEFRTRLIADVVTGKLDVRALAASLPETVELEPIDDLVEGDDLDEAIDDAENEEVAA